MGLAFSIARRFLKSNKGQTALILVGIAIGVSVQIFIGSLIEGLQISLLDKTIGSSSHISIYSSEDERFFTDPQALVLNLKADQRFSAVSKTLESPALLVNKEETYPITLKGFKIKDANDIYNFREKLVKGRLPQRRLEIILGKDLVDNMNVKIGDKIQLSANQAKADYVELVGVYDLKVASINKNWAITSLQNAEYILNQKDKITTIEMQMKEVFDADIVAGEIDRLITDNTLEVSNWKDQNEDLLAGITGQSSSSYLIQVFVLLSVILGIASVLAISVMQKSRQIGILKAMGIKDRVASYIFLIQGFILGIIGSVLGAGLGVSLTFIFSRLITNQDGTALVPFYLDYGFILASILLATLAATLAALIPARKSSKLNPIEVIQNG